MNKIISDFLTSRQGLWTRHALAVITPVLTGWAALANQHGIPGEITEPLIAAATAGVALAIQLALSRIADRANKALTPPKK